tara:strand:+ start:255 stop:479 length:225 start_codon:yes stop_codon:yes gene_type:complete
MSKKTNALPSNKVVNITHDVEILDGVEISYDSDDNPTVKAIWSVPDPDGTMRNNSRPSAVDPETFITAVFDDTK